MRNIKIKDKITRMLLDGIHYDVLPAELRSYTTYEEFCSWAAGIDARIPYVNVAEEVKDDLAIRPRQIDAILRMAAASMGAPTDQLLQQLSRLLTVRGMSADYVGIWIDNVLLSIMSEILNLEAYLVITPTTHTCYNTQIQRDFDYARESHRAPV